MYSSISFVGFFFLFWKGHFFTPLTFQHHLLPLEFNIGKFIKVCEEAVDKLIFSESEAVAAGLYVIVFIAKMLLILVKIGYIFGPLLPRLDPFFQD